MNVAHDNTDTIAADGTATAIPPGTTRYYRVAATNNSDADADPDPNRGPFSASVRVTTPKAGLPDEPGWPAARAAVAVGLQTVELNWMKPTGAILGYKIERSTDGGKNWAVAANNEAGITVVTDGVTAVYYSDRHASLAGKKVRYRVAAINSIGTGPVSSPTSPVTVPLPVAGEYPGAPTGLTVVATSLTTATISWTAPAQSGPEVTGYTVQWSKDGELPWTTSAPPAVLDRTPATATMALAMEPIIGVTHYYRVAAKSGMAGDDDDPEKTGPYSAPATAGGAADQPGTVTLSTQEPMTGGSITATLVDDDGMISGQVWKWEKSTNQASWMAATGSGAMTRTYTPVAADEGNYLRAMVTYTDAIGPDRTAYSDATTGMVTLPTDQMGTVTLSTTLPAVGTAITATLADADGMVTGQTWQWEKSTDNTSWMDATGSGAMTSSYTPADADMDYYLRATVTYTDKYRSDRMASSDATSDKVTAADPLLVKYDTDPTDGRIDRSEVITAIRDYLADPPMLSRADVIKVIRLYFSTLDS